MRPGQQLILALLPLLLAACHGRHTASTTRPYVCLLGLSPPAPIESVEAIAVPPLSWRMEPLKKSDRHTHQVWISPTGNTAYGIIRARMPLPFGPELALVGFLREMRRTEGQATLISRQTDPDLPGIRFVAEGGRYRIRVKLMSHAWTAWAVYAGTLRGKDELPDELSLAERAREATLIGLP
jgi:hypothetical protein